MESRIQSEEPKLELVMQCLHKYLSGMTLVHMTLPWEYGDSWVLEELSKSPSLLFYESSSKQSQAYLLKHMSFSNKRSYHQLFSIQPSKDLMKSGRKVILCEWIIAWIKAYYIPLHTVLKSVL